RRLPTVRLQELPITPDDRLTVRTELVHVGPVDLLPQFFEWQSVFESRLQAHHNYVDDPVSDAWQVVAADRVHQLSGFLQNERAMQLGRFLWHQLGNVANW